MSPLLDTIGSRYSRALGFWDTNTNIGHDDIIIALHHTFSAFARLLQKITFAHAFFILVSGKSNPIFARHWLVLPIYIGTSYH
jgi:hypothetical protein